jgi:hypothetical protein
MARGDSHPFRVLADSIIPPDWVRTSSSVARYSDPDSRDIDLVVATQYLTESNKGRLLAELARAMRLAHITDTVAIISKARVPIIKFVTNEGETALLIACDHDC